MTTTEIWKQIDGFSRYYVSNFGRIKHIENGIKKLKFDKNGYITVGLWHGRKKKLLRVHRLVALAFIPNPQNKREVNHIDFDRTNNCVNNLQWVTPRENNVYSLSNRPKEYQLYTSSTTKEKWISFNKKRETYQVLVKKKYYGVYKTLEDAIKVRDKVLANYEKYSSN